MTASEERWVIHVPVVVPDLSRARIFARTATRALALLTTRIDAGEVTVSTEDAQGVRHRVFCDRQLTGGGRCTLPTDHLAPCARSGPTRHRRP
ncbi:hypothetical protein [Micromonospora inyonensis]|uniref:Uncharacterized protein n=1 Tax=Micromonospora inyonensis TaxID=47866 RepID=A0A1C6RIT4_9ACTN|nr:hypothetical protein [Micromonospora inyonensis]SCL17106.1 hypothetical protein GA0074694_1893 [Micromonospora inyonensis]